MPKITPTGSVGSMFVMGTFGRFPESSDVTGFQAEFRQQIQANNTFVLTEISWIWPFEREYLHVSLCTLEELGVQPLLHAQGACIGLPRSCSTIVSRQVSLPRSRYRRSAAETHSRAPTSLPG